MKIKKANKLVVFLLTMVMVVTSLPINVLGTEIGSEYESDSSYLEIGDTGDIDSEESEKESESEIETEIESETETDSLYYVVAVQPENYGLEIIEVRTSNELRRALGATGPAINSLPVSYANGTTLIKVMNNITLGAAAEVVSPPAGDHRHIILIAEESVTITVNGVRDHFTVNNRTTLTIDDTNLNIVGRNPNSSRTTSSGGGIRVNSGGELVLNEGTITNIHRSWPYGAVNIRTGGLFTMNGGIVENNRSNHGGGVSIDGRDARFVMNDGIIRDNFGYGYSGGVDLNNHATFDMYGGMITNNISSTSGGGLRADTHSTFNMHDGIISHNTANGGGNTGGGGVAVFGTGVFNMHGGTISHNDTRDAGGGVRLNSGGVFNMFDGVIEYNEVRGGTLYPYGGGVAFLHAGSTFNMNGGAIRNNEAPIGGGVVAWEAVFNMGTGHVGRGRASHTTTSENIPMIYGNRANVSTARPSGIFGHAGGGGVYVYGMNAGRSNINFIMNSGDIFDNSAQVRGGGVFLNAANFRMNGGSITNNRTDSDNNANNMGGGIFLHNYLAGSFPASFDMRGGTLMGNYARNGGGIARIDQRNPIRISEGSISSNYASNNGGGIFTNASTNTVINATNVQANRGNLTIGENVNFYLNIAREGSLGLTVAQVAQFASSIHNNINWNGANSVNGERDVLTSHHLFNNFDIDNNVGTPITGTELEPWPTPDFDPILIPYIRIWAVPLEGLDIGVNEIEITFPDSDEQVVVDYSIIVDGERVIITITPEVGVIHDGTEINICILSMWEFAEGSTVDTYNNTVTIVIEEVRWN